MWTIENDLPIHLAVLRIEEVIVTDDKKAFWKLQECGEGYRRTYGDREISRIPEAQYGRRLFHAIGQDPTKRRPSSEALLHRALKQKAFHAINTLVDVGNWCSLDFLLPICIYDADCVFGAVHVRRGQAGETYLGHNDQIMNMENRYVIADEQGPFGSPITDSQRAAVNEHSRNIFQCIFAPDDFDLPSLQRCADLYAERTCSYCGGRIVENYVL